MLESLGKINDFSLCRCHGFFDFLNFGEGFPITESKNLWTMFADQIGRARQPRGLRGQKVEFAARVGILRTTACEDEDKLCSGFRWRTHLILTGDSSSRCGGCQLSNLRHRQGRMS